MNPQTNNNPAGNQSQFFGQKVSIPGINVNDAGDNELIMQDNYSTRLYYNTSGIATVLLGTRVANSNNGIGTNQQGFYVSQPSIDVRNATDSQLIFNSSQDIFKIALEGTASQSPGIINSQSLNTLTIAHGLSITPAVIAYVQVPSGTDYIGSSGLTSLPNSLFSATGGTIMYNQVRVDDTNIYFDLINPSGININWTGFTWTYKYYALEETALT